MKTLAALFTCSALLTMGAKVKGQEFPKGQAPATEEASYQGKPVTLWLSELKDRNAAVRSEAVRALDSIGRERPRPPFRP